jgi:hypothetical protein
MLTSINFKKNCSLNNSDFKRLGNNASYQEILEGMKNTNTGLGFLTQHQNLPPYTFSSADAIQWLLTHVENLTYNRATEIMEVNKRLNRSIHT